jgi:hypothetical protein
MTQIIIEYAILAIVGIILLLQLRRWIISKRFPYYRHMQIGQLRSFCVDMLRKPQKKFYIGMRVEGKEDCFLQFLLCREDSGRRYILDYPVSTDTKPYYQKLLPWIRSKNLAVSEVANKSYPVHSKAEFTAEVDFRDDFDTMQAFIEHVFRNVYPAGSDDKYEAFYAGTMQK